MTEYKLNTMDDVFPSGYPIQKLDLTELDKEDPEKYKLAPMHRGRTWICSVIERHLDSTDIINLGKTKELLKNFYGDSWEESTLNGTYFGELVGDIKARSMVQDALWLRRNHKDLDIWYTDLVPGDAAVHYRMTAFYYEDTRESKMFGEWVRRFIDFMNTCLTWRNW